MEPRPKRFTEENSRKLAEKFAPRIIVDSSEGLKEVEDDLFDAIENTPELDGYSLAKYLDDHCGYTPDWQMVEALNNVDLEANRIHNRQVREWVERNKIQPKHQTGDTVWFSFHTPPRDWKKGEVVSIDYPYAKYIILEGDHKWVLSYENVKAAFCGICGKEIDPKAGVDEVQDDVHVRCAIDQ